MLFEFLDLKPRNPYLSLALDEAIALFYGKLRSEEFRGGIRLWANPPSVILGRTCKSQENVTEQLLDAFRTTSPSRPASGMPYLCRRSSGGGTVLHGPGNINYSIFLSLDKFPKTYDVKNSYKMILGMVQRALEAQGVNCEIRGQSDLALSDESGHLKKISGNAQFRKYGVLMHHGTLITRKNLVESVAQFLKHPPKEPDYRKGRDHGDFLGSVPDTFDFTAFYNYLAREMRGLFEANAVVPLPNQDRAVILHAAKRLVREIYGSSEWILEGKGPDASGASIRDRDVLESFMISRLARQPLNHLITNPQNRAIV